MREHRILLACCKVFPESHCGALTLDIGSVPKRPILGVMPASA
jgi:hypothetical protein